VETRNDDVINKFLNGVMPGKPTTVEVVKGLVHGKEEITVNLRRPPEEPLRRESPPRAHTFNSIDGFAAYLSRYGTENVLVLADPDTGEMAAVLDERAVNGFETVYFEPKLHPLYKPWQNLMHDLTQIKAFAQFIQSHKETLAMDHQTICAVFQQIRVSKNITVQQGVGARSTNGIMCETVIQGQLRNAPVELPDRLAIHCPMFVDTPEVEIVLDLMIDGDGDDVRVRVTSSDAENKRVEMIQHMLEQIQGLLPKGTVSLGTVDHDQWSYVYPAE